MASYRIEWKSSASKELRKLSKTAISHVLRAIEALADDPRPDGIRKLTISRNTYRIRVGDIRVVYNIYDKRLIVEVIRVRNRKEAYR